MTAREGWLEIEVNETISSNASSPKPYCNAARAASVRTRPKTPYPNANPRDGRGVRQRRYLLFANKAHKRAIGAALYSPQSPAPHLDIVSIAQQQGVTGRQVSNGTGNKSLHHFGIGVHLRKRLVVLIAPLA